MSLFGGWRSEEGAKWNVDVVGVMDPLMQPIIPEHMPGQSCLHVFLSGHQVIAGEYSSLSLSMGETEAGQ